MPVLSIVSPSDAQTQEEALRAAEADGKADKPWYAFNVCCNCEGKETETSSITLDVVTTPEGTEANVDVGDDSLRKEAGGEDKSRGFLSTLAAKVEDAIEGVEKRLTDKIYGEDQVAKGDLAGMEERMEDRIQESYGNCEEDAQISVETLMKRAQAHMKATACTVLSPKTGQREWRPLFGTTPAHLGGYGVGVQLYFEFLFGMGLVFLFLFLLNCPLVVISLMGNAVNEVPGNEDTSFLNKMVAWMTVGNLGSCPGSQCLVQEDYTSKTVSQDGTAKISGLVEWIGILDAISIIVFGVSGLLFKLWWIPRTVRKQDDAHVTAADFGLTITNLPKRLKDPETHKKYEELLKEHIERILVSDCGYPEERAKDAVKEVTLVREYDGAISKFMQQGELLEQKYNSEVAKVKAQKAGDDKIVQKMNETVKKLEEKAVRLEVSLAHQASMQDEDREVCFAILMLNSEDMKDSLLHTYRMAKSLIFRNFQHSHRRFMNYPMTLRQACEPTDLFWENLDYHPLKHLTKKVLTVVFALFCVACAMCALVWLRSVDKAANTSVHAQDFWMLRWPASKASCLQICEWRLGEDHLCASPSPAWNVKNVFDNNGSQCDNTTCNTHALLEPGCQSSWSSPGCSGATVTEEMNFVSIVLQEKKAVKCMQLWQNGTSNLEVMQLWACSAADVGSFSSWSDLTKHCIRMSDIHLASYGTGGLAGNAGGHLQVKADEHCEMTVSLSAAQYALANGEDSIEGHRIRCFCERMLKEKGALFRSPPFRSDEQKVCSDFLTHQNTKSIKLGLGVLGILVLNQVLLLIFMFLDVQARYRTATDLAKSQTFNLFLSTLINTGVTYLIVGMNFKSSISVGILKTFSIGEGIFDDMNTLWFINVGTTLLITILCQVACSVSMAIGWIWVVDPLIRRIGQRGLVTQKPLNDVYTFPEWTLSLRLAESLTIVFCVMMYSGGMPLLYLVGTLYCFLAYWGDKWCLLRGSREPPAYDHRLFHSIMVLIPVAVFLHLALTLWMYGNQELMPSDWSALRPFGEALFGISLDEYHEVMSIYRNAATDVQQLYFWKYTQARMLDMCRKSCWMPFLVLMCFLVYYILSMLVYVMSPFCTCLEVVVLESVLRLKKSSDKKVPGEDHVTAETYAEAKIICERDHNGIFSYKMDANPRYKEANDALQYDPDPDYVKRLIEISGAPVQFIRGLMKHGSQAVNTLTKSGDAMEPSDATQT